MELVNAPEFFSTARERYQILFKRTSGAPKPWTEDKIFQSWRFCNVHREHDRTTMWLKDNVRDLLSEVAFSKGIYAEDSLINIVDACMIFRWFNRIETGEKIKHLLLGQWDEEDAREILKDVHPVVTGAYIIKGPDGKDKLNGVLYCVRLALPHIPGMVQRWQREGHCLQNAWADLCNLYYLGPFMSYELVSDLRWTPVLDTAIDINTWCNLGPGAARGLKWVTADKLRNSNSQRDQREMLEWCRELLAMSKDSKFWPGEWRPWEMREVEHWLCEYDKYKRAQNGERLKRGFKG